MIKKSIGIVCFGGAIRGTFHSGFLFSCRESGLVFDQYVGVSAGFFACLTSIAHLDYKGFWSDKKSPIYKDAFKKNMFDAMAEFYTSEILAKSSISEKVLLEKANQKLSALANKLTWRGLQLVSLNSYKNFEEIGQVQLVSGSLPWVIQKWPYTYKGASYLDGCLFNRRPENFLYTDVKVITDPTPFWGSPLQEKYNYRCRYPKVLKTALHGTISEYEEIWDSGYHAGKRFIADLKDSEEGGFFFHN